MPHQWVIRKSSNGEYRAYYEYNGEKIWWTEGYRSKASAQNAIDSAKRNAPGAPVESEPEGDEPEDEFQRFRETVVASADLIIAPDHRSAEYRAFERALFKFTDKIRTSNDLHNLDGDDIDVAKAELAQIKETGSRHSFRAESLWNMTKTSVLWIAEKTADGVVQALGAALLAALAALLGMRIR